MLGGIIKVGLQNTWKRELKEIRKRVAPFNRATKRPMANPFKEGDLIFFYQQQMEETHKLSLRW